MPSVFTATHVFIGPGPRRIRLLNGRRRNFCVSTRYLLSISNRESKLLSLTLRLSSLCPLCCPPLSLCPPLPLSLCFSLSASTHLHPCFCHLRRPYFIIVLHGGFDLLSTTWPPQSPSGSTVLFSACFIRPSSSSIGSTASLNGSLHHQPSRQHYLLGGTWV